MAANLSLAKEGPVVLVELGVVEAVSGVLEVLNGAEVIDASRRYGMVPPRTALRAVASESRRVEWCNRRAHRSTCKRRNTAGGARAATRRVLGT